MEARFRQPRGDGVDLSARQAIDDAGLACVLRKERLQLGALVVAFDDAGKNDKTIAGKK